ncbi:hypothetical protein VTI74DRAFT_879 [Chaetomium olivicolor]
MGWPALTTTAHHLLTSNIGEAARVSGWLSVVLEEGRYSRQQPKHQPPAIPGIGVEQHTFFRSQPHHLAQQSRLLAKVAEAGRLELPAGCSSKKPTRMLKTTARSETTSSPSTMQWKSVVGMGGASGSHMPTSGQAPAKELARPTAGAHIILHLRVATVLSKSAQFRVVGASQSDGVYPKAESGHQATCCCRGWELATDALRLTLEAKRCLPRSALALSALLAPSSHNTSDCAILHTPPAGPRSHQSRRTWWT